MSIENPNSQPSINSSEQALSDHLVRRAIQAYESGDVESFNNAASIYDEIHRGASADLWVDEDVEDVKVTEKPTTDVTEEYTHVPDFIIPHDGTQPEISAKEKAVVAKRLSSLIDTLFLNHADQVWHSSFDSTDHLLLRLAVNPSVKWTIGVDRKTEEEPSSDTQFEPAELIKESISIQRIVNEYGQEYFSYRLGGDNVVRRWTDADGARAKALSGELMPPGASQDELIEHLEKKIAEITEVHIPNGRLERQMGLNMQPVGLEEITDLQKFLMEAKLEVPPMFRRVASA